MQVGSSDGSVTVWKNVSVSRLSAGAHPSAGTPQTANRSSGFDSGDKTNLCASFLALPDIDCSPSVDDKGKYYTFPIPLPAKQGMDHLYRLGLADVLVSDVRVPHSSREQSHHPTLGSDR